MRFGVGLPHEAGGDISFVLDYAVEAEGVGFDSLLMADHVFFENEVLTTFAGVAMRTRKVKLIPFVLDGNRRDPATLAHMTATLDRLSGGRLILGIGKGVWNEAYYGFDVQEPVSRMEETIRLLKKFWAGEEVTYSSRFFKYNKARSLKAQPSQSPHPPVWVAAFGERMLRIASRIGDGFITQNVPPNLLRKIVEDASENKERESGFEAVYGAMPVAISNNREDARRRIEPSARGFLVRHAGRLCPALGYEKTWTSPEEVPDEVVDDCFLFGAKRDIESKVEEYVGTGVDHLMFQQVLPIGSESLRMLSEVLEGFR